jgi:predicted ATPase/DNA-binding SARP family transcriptional activator
MRILVLGPLRVQPEVPIGGRQLRLLLTLFALEAGRVVPAAVLAERLWPGSEAERGNALQTLVSRLRAALREAGADGLIESHPTGYRLAVPPEAVDALEFGELAEQGRRALAAGDAGQASLLLTRALDLWRGQPLADAAGCEYADAVAFRLAGLREEAVLHRLEADLDRGAGVPAAVGELRAIVAADPLAERPRALLMRALYADGRQAEALACYAQARDVLAEQLGADPSPALEEVYLRILRGESQPEQHVVLPAVPAPLTSFVGRDEELTQLGKLLGSGRLVTLTGPGGVGKTRLAAEIAGRLDGPVWFVPLAPVSDPGEVPYTVLDVLGIRAPVIRVGAGQAADPLDRLSRTLAARDDVLILDNCEHVIDAAAVLAARLLSACPRLRIMATSREPLRTDGESLLPVPPLPFPRAGSGFSAAESYASVRLLCDRAAAVRPGFAFGDGNAAAIARICRALDGMPLAIELAAVWLRVLSADQLAERLDDRFALLAGGSRTALPRHQTLRAVVDWSWELLSEPEQALARRLSLFPAGATLEAAEQVCADGGNGSTAGAGLVLNTLSTVVDKSILAAVPATGDVGTRYVMLETVRAYCLERLAAAGETRRYLDAFAAYYVELAERADPELRGRDQARWMGRLLAEQDNLYAALRWAVSQRDADTAYRLVRGLGWFWMLRGQRGEARALAREVLALAPADGSLPMAEARVICGLTVAGSSWDLDSVRDEMTEATAAFLGLVRENPAAAFHPLASFGPPILALTTHDPERAVAMFDWYQETSDRWLRAAVPFFRGMFGGFLGRIREAEEACQGALAAFRALGDAWGTAAVLIQLAEFHRFRGEFAAGIAALEEAEELGSLLGAWGDLAQIGGLLATYRMRVGDLAGARADLDRSIRLSADQEGSGNDASIWYGLTEVELLWCQGDLRAAGRRCTDVIAMIAAKDSDWYAGIAGIALARQAMIALRLGDRDRCRVLLADALRTASHWVEHPPVAAVIDAVAAFIVPDDPRSAASLLGVACAVRGIFDESSLDALAVRDTARAALGREAFDEAFRQGGALGYADGMELACGGGRRARPAARTRSRCRRPRPAPSRRSWPPARRSAARGRPRSVTSSDSP